MQFDFYFYFFYFLGYKGKQEAQEGKEAQSFKGNQLLIKSYQCFFFFSISYSIFLSLRGKFGVPGDVHFPRFSVSEFSLKERVFSFFLMCCIMCMLASFIFNSTPICRRKSLYAKCGE